MFGPNSAIVALAAGITNEHKLREIYEVLMKATGASKKFLLFYDFNDNSNLQTLQDDWESYVSVKFGGNYELAGNE